MSQWSRRTQTWLWSSAVAVSLAPFAMVPIFTRSQGSTKITFGYFTGFECDGWEGQWFLQSVPGYVLLQGMLFLLVIPAFVLWLVTRRRAVGWTAVAALAALTLPELALMSYDVARLGQECVEPWFPLDTWSVAGWAYRFAVLALVLAAVYRPGRTAIRSFYAILVVSLLVGLAGGEERPPFAVTAPEDCRNVLKSRRAAADPDVLAQTVRAMSHRERERTYICRVRRYTQPSVPASFRTSRHYETVPVADGDLLRYGRHMCRGDLSAPVQLQGRDPRGRPLFIPPSMEDLAFLCPEYAVPRLREHLREVADRTAQFERERARDKAHCRRTAPKGPRPVRQSTQLMYGGEASNYSLYGGGPESNDPFSAAVDDGLVAGVGNGATVVTGTESDFCLTVRSYRKAPPLALSGWDRVAEVGFDSVDGKIIITRMDWPDDDPELALGKPGPYRLRVYVRGRNDETPYSEPPAEQHLLVVFPGASKEQKLYKNTER